jgi:Undecaprenyl-phosphate galactose phosphotransferase WbaP
LDSRDKEQRLSVTQAPAEYERLLHATDKKRWKPVWRHRLNVVTLALTDVLLAFLTWGLAYVAQGFWGQGEVTDVAVVAIVPSVAIWVGLRAFLGLYPGYGLDSVERLRRHTYSVFAALAVLTVFAVGFQAGNLLSRIMLAIAFLGLLFLTPFVQHFVKLGMKRAGLWGKPVIILGYGDTGAHFWELLEREWGLGYSPVALLGRHLVAAGGSYREIPCEETFSDAANLGRELGVNTVILAMPYTRREQLARLSNLASLSFRQVIVIPNLSGITNSAVVARDFAGTFGVEIRHNLLDPWSRRVKRGFDLLGAVVGGLLISPLLLTLCVLIKLDSPGSAIFVQERPGHNGRMFRIFKFRTMYADAERRFDQLVLLNPLLGEEFEKHGKLKDDPRVTRVGRWLRRSSLDELPQIWNVIRGDMSLVGPRPYLVSQAAQVQKAGLMIARVTPGITGLWQVSGRSGITFEQRVGLDTYYVRNWSIWLDLVILARTALIVILRQGAY